MENIINDIVNGHYKLYNFTTILSVKEKEYLIYLMNNESIMKKLNDSLNNINDKLDFNNIFDIILFISNLCIDNNKFNLDVINIIKILIEIIIYIKINKSNNEDLEIMYNMINSCIILLELSTKKKNISCFKLFKTK
jgi:hypothetical protein